ncbi:MAG: hypothetical protein M1602_03180 [Firmicutes bacterium]|nr:hypothetical protein [Bacillota bacterium]
MEVVACAVQLAARACESPSDLAALLGDPVRAAARAGARLMALPQLADLVGRDRPLQAEVPRVAAELAREAKVYLAVGAAEAGNAGFIFSPDGEMLGWQRQTHLLPEDTARGLVAGDELAIFDTEIGCLGLVVGADAWYPEVSRILALQGAEILISLQAVQRPYTQWRQVAGMWQEVQQNQTFGIESCLHGRVTGPSGESFDAVDMEFEGRSAIFAPCEMTPGETGVLNDAPDADGLVIARLDFAARRRVIEQYSVLGLLNPPLYHRYFPGVYAPRPAPGGPGDGGEGGAGR